MLKVIGEPGLVRDPNSKALLNTDTSSLQEHRKKREMYKQLNDSVNSIGNINSEIDGIKQEMLEIKSMLIQLINK